MTITQTVDIPDSHRLTIDVPREVPAGRTVLTFTPALEQRSAAAENDGLDYEGDCPLCAKYRDSETGELRFNAVTLAAMQEARDIASGKIPGKWHYSIEEAREELDV